MSNRIYYNGVGTLNQLWFNKSTKGKFIWNFNSKGKLNVYFGFSNKENPSTGGRFVDINNLFKFILEENFMYFSSNNKKDVDFFTKACKEVLKDEYKYNDLDISRIFKLISKYYAKNKRNIFSNIHIDTIV